MLRLRIEVLPDPPQHLQCQLARIGWSNLSGSGADVSDVNRTRRTLRVASLIAAGIVITCFLWITSVANLSLPPGRAFTLPWWTLALGFAMAEFFTFEIRFASHGLKVSFSETILVVGLLFSGSPAEVLTAALAGVVFGYVFLRRLPPLKSAFNATLAAAEVVLAWAVFSAINPMLEVEGTRVWIGVFVAAMSTAVLSHIAVATVICVTTQEWRLLRFADPRMLTTVNAATSTSLGIIAAAVLHTEPWLILFLATPLALVLTLHQHIARRHTAEQQVRESQDLLNAIVDNSASVIYVKDMEGRYVLVNRAWESLAGVDGAGVLGRLPHDVLTPELAADFTASDQHVYETGEPFLIEESALLADGERMFVSTRFPLLDDDGQMFALGGISTDITATKALEKAAQEQAQLFTSAFQGAHAGMAVILPNGRYLEVNNAFCEMLGYTREELLGTDWMSVTHAEDLRENIPRSVQLLSGERDCHVYEKRFVHKNGHTVICELSDAVVRDPQGDATYFVTHIHDVTKQREHETQLRQAQKMEAVGQLAGGIAHDFNNLLGVMLNYAQFAADALDPEDRAKQDLIEVINAAERAAGLTRQLLAFSRKEPNSPRAVDLGEAVGGLSEMLRRSLPENIEITTRSSAPAIHVMIDPNQLEQIILNLAVNARDAMPGGGRLTLTTERISIDEAWSGERRGLSPGTYARLRVVDSGTGMPPDVLDRVFEPFFTTKERGRGTGLGLATVYGIVKSAGGYISVSSGDGAGTTFSIYLPSTEEAIPVPTIAPATLGQGSDGSERLVLVIEDEPSVRRLTQRVLLRSGFKVATAASGAEAIALVVEERLMPDLVITDVIMPGLSGKETVERIREHLPSLPILYISGYSDDILAIQAFGSDESILPKPFRGEQLLQEVWTLLDANPADHQVRSA